MPALFKTHKYDKLHNMVFKGENLEIFMFC